MSPNHENEARKYKRVIEKIKTGMMVTSYQSDSIKSRPMETIRVDDNGDLWFFTNEFSEKALKISGNNEVLISYSHPTSNDYLVINGLASIVTDKDKMKELGQPVVRMWFPRGLNDTKLCLLKVEPLEVEYWSGNTNKFLVFFKMVTAMFSGDVYKIGEYGKFGLRATCFARNTCRDPSATWYDRYNPSFFIGRFHGGVFLSKIWSLYSS